LFLLTGVHKRTQANDIKIVLQLARTFRDINMSKTTTRYDVAEHLRTPAEMAAYLEVSIEEANGDALFVAKALGDIARAKKGMSQVARDAGLSRESLYKALSGERMPSFDTVLKVIRALGLTLRAEPLIAEGAAVTPHALEASGGETAESS
jgi:probable addiction module antidote protein